MSNTRHVLGISGGKDSAALAIYLKQKKLYPDMEYYFSDTGCELPETYEFIDKLEVYLGKKILRIGIDKTNNPKSMNNNKGISLFNHFLIMHNGMLPSPQQRWCTVKMKLEPFEKYIGSSDAISYIAIRADEFREGYISTKPNIKPVFPFILDGITRKDVFNILEDTVGIPEYYKWRSRSGCYFCFFQRREEWVRLNENHPDLFEKAKQYEKYDSKTGKRYTWVEGMTLDELIVKKEKYIQHAKRKKSIDNRNWQDKLIEDYDGSEEQGCLLCTL